MKPAEEPMTDPEMITRALVEFAARRRDDARRILDWNPDANVGRAVATARRADQLAKTWPQMAATSTPANLITLTVWCDRHRVPATTARRWARNGLLTGATQDLGRWLIPPGTPPPRSTTT